MATSLVDYAGSDDDIDEESVDYQPEIDFTASSKVLSSLKNRVLIDSTPAVPMKVGGA